MNSGCDHQEHDEGGDADSSSDDCQFHALVFCANDAGVAPDLTQEVVPKRCLAAIEEFRDIVRLRPFLYFLEEDKALLPSIVVGKIGAEQVVIGHEESDE